MVAAVVFCIGQKPALRSSVVEIKVLKVIGCGL